MRTGVEYWSQMDVAMLLGSEAQLDCFLDDKDDKSLVKLIACVGKERIREVLEALFTESEITAHFSL